MESRKGQWALIIGVLLTLVGISSLVGGVGMLVRHEPSPVPPRQLASAVSPSVAEEKVAELRKQTAVLEEKVKASESRLLVERKANDPLREQVNELRLARDILDAEVRKLRPLEAELAGVKGKAADLAQQVETLGKKSGQTNEQLQAAAKEASALKTQVAALEAQVKTLTAAKTAAEAGKAAAEKATADAQAAGKAQADRAAALQAEVQKLTAAQQQLDARCKSLEGQCRDLEAKVKALTPPTTSTTIPSP